MRRRLFRILLVEDDPEDVRRMRRAVDRTVPAVQMNVVSDGEEAIDYLRGATRLQPSLVLLDIRMPKKSGLDVLAWIRSCRDFVRVPVVMLTGSMNPADISQALNLGANSYLVKPVSLTSLQDSMGALVGYWSAFNQTGDLF